MLDFGSRIRIIDLYSFIEGMQVSKYLFDAGDIVRALNNVPQYMWAEVCTKLVAEHPSLASDISFKIDSAFIDRSMVEEVE